MNGVTQWEAKEIINTVLNTLWANPAYPIVTGGQCLLMEHGITPRKAWHISRKCLNEFLTDEGISVGDPAYGWGPAEGRKVVQAYEIDHWEAEQ